MPLFLAQVLHGYGGGFKVSADPREAVREARRHVGATASTERCHYVLEFPDGTEITVSTMDGGWTASAAPTRVVERRKVPADVTDEQLLGRNLDQPKEETHQ
jgi:hypothetical protein